jgi:hypothetical protein
MSMSDASSPARVLSAICFPMLERHMSSVSHRCVFVCHCLGPQTNSFLLLLYSASIYVMVYVPCYVISSVSVCNLMRGLSSLND